MTTSFLQLLHSPAAGFDEPQQLLAACHDRVRRTLSLLERLHQHLHTAGAHAQARSAAADVRRYFSVAAPAHHEDEERHLVPLLQASADAADRVLADRLLDEHSTLRQLWARVDELLATVESGACPSLTELGAATHDFVARHADHLAFEDEVVFPRTEGLLALHDPTRLTLWRQAMGREMASRRGVPFTE